MKTIERVLELPQGSSCHLVMTRYSNDKVLVVISNTGTFGAIVQAQKERSLQGGETFNVSMTLGDRNDNIPELCVRMVLESAGKVWGRETVFPSFVFCLGIQKQCMLHKTALTEIVQQVVSVLQELYTC